MFKVSYTIELENEAYINAIAKYNSKIVITSMQNSLTGNEIIIPKNKNLGNLKKILHNISSQDPSVTQIKITGMSKNSTSVIGIFHPIPEHPKAIKINPVAEAHFQKAYASTYGDDDDWLTEPLNEFTKEEAIAIAQQYAAEAIELPELNTILFQRDEQCFYLKYGDSPGIGHIPYMHFKIDEGFSFYVDKNSYLIFKDLEAEEHGNIDPQKKAITKKLQEQFVTWKNNDYAGNLFPDSMKIKIEQPNLPKPSLLNSLLVYKKNREGDSREYFHPFKMAEYLPFWRLKGYTKTQKINTVNKIIECIENKENILTKEDLKICRQGGLGKIISDWEKKENISLEEYMTRPSLSRPRS